MARRAPRVMSLALLAAACAGTTPRTNRDPAPSPVPPAPPPTVHATSGLPAVEPDASSPVAEQDEPDATTCKPRGPALDARVCDEARLVAELRELEGSDGEYEGFVRCQPLSVEDLEPVEPKQERAGDLQHGPGFFGDHDVNADGVPDVVRLYQAVDFWRWFVFVREPACLRFVAAIDGYQVELRVAKHKGLRDVRVLPYPLQSSVETRVFDGKRFVSPSRQKANASSR